jgi:uncharacterized protein
MVDTGVLVAYLSAKDANHAWATRVFGAIQGPMLTCEPVLAEAAYLVRNRGGTLDSLWAFLRRGVLRVTFRLDVEFEAVAALMHRYENVPMDLADACLVRMTELNRDSCVLTTDGDFRIYRRLGRQVIPCMLPA